MDARAFAKEPALPPFQNTWDIRQSYIELGDSENKPFGLSAGRQELLLGEQRLVGNALWTNTEHVFDAIRGTIRGTAGQAGYRIDAFAASVVNPATGARDHHRQGDNLHGLYGGIERLVPEATIEPYIMWRLQPGVGNEHGVIAHLNEKIAGVHVTGKLPLGFDYGTEMVREFGSLGADRIRSWAGHWVVGRTAASVPFTPGVFAEFNYASGDRNSKDGTRGTFDQLYPSGHDLYGVADQAGWRNIKDTRAGIGVKPRGNVTASFEYNNFSWPARPTRFMPHPEPPLRDRQPAQQARTWARNSTCLQPGRFSNRCWPEPVSDTLCPVSS
jgi:hypothetical protein